MDFDGPNIFAGILFSLVGLFYVRHGRRVVEMKFVLSGAMLMAYAYFTPSVVWTVVVGLVLSAIPFLPFV